MDGWKCSRLYLFGMAVFSGISNLAGSRNGLFGVDAAPAVKTAQRVERKTILAVASGGGHWVQLLRLMPAFKGHDVVFVTVNPAYESDVTGSDFHSIEDATRWNKLGLLKMTLHMAKIIRQVKPDIIVTTGAAPGYVSVVLARVPGLRAQTVWLDSMANVERLSMCGKWVGRHADLWLTQWPELARPGGPHYVGATV